MPNKLKNIVTILFILLHLSSYAQIKGVIKDEYQKPLQGVSVRIENTYSGTSTNNKGEFEIAHPKTDSFVLVFQSLGFKTKKITLSNVDKTRYITVTLEELEQKIEEIVIKNNTNPADRIIRSTIKNKKINNNRLSKFEADFYSKGTFRINEVPKKILGKNVEVPDFKDTSKSKIIYLSETVSKLKVSRPKHFQEHIIASKTSGDSHGISMNRATEVDIEFYNDYVYVEDNALISPISTIAFNYYSFALEDSFEEDNQLIYKIRVKSKRENEPAFNGHIYVVDDSYELYAVQLNVLGKAFNTPLIDTLFVKQQYGFHKKDKIWSKNLQIIDLKASIFGFKLSGGFTHLFSNYLFVDKFDKKSFNKIETTFDKDANRKDSIYWTNQRHIPLSKEETKDYIQREVEAKQEQEKVSKPFEPKNVFGEYNYQNNNINIKYKNVKKLSYINFNTVQGLNFRTDFVVNIENYRKARMTTIGLDLNYGLADENLFGQIYFKHKINNKNNASFQLRGGTTVSQFHESPSMKPFLNTIYSLIIGENYMKLYGNDFVKGEYRQYLSPNIKINAELQFASRTNVYNATDYSFVKKPNYTSNNPLNPTNEISDAFINHKIWKSKVSIDVYFKTSMEQLPNKLVYNHESNYPKLNLAYTQAFGSNIEEYNYHKAEATIAHQIKLGNKGVFNYKTNLGKFFSADKISFIDYKHVNANQTNIVLDNSYRESFLNLPYYTHSTNKAYAELHAEHNFQGFILNKIPLISKLNLETVVGYHVLATELRKPYQEVSIGLNKIGIGKYRVLRIDYVRSYNGAHKSNALLFGLGINL